MARLSYLVLVTLLALLLFGCGKEQDKTVINYSKALDAGKFDEAASYLSKDARQLLDQAGGTSLLAAAANAFKQHKGVKSVEITERNVAGDKAMVKFIYKFKDGSKVQDYFPLVKEGNAWKISR